MQSGGLLKLYQVLWAPYYQAVLNILGSTGVVLPLGDPHHGQPNATTFTTKGEEQVTFTWSEPPSSFDTPLDLTDADGFQGIVPVVTFNGTDEDAESPDAAYWSLGDGTAGGDIAVSMGAWFIVNATATAKVILSKFAGLEREWKLIIMADETVILNMRDESAGVEVRRTSDAALSTGVWHHLVCTRPSGGTGATAMDNALIYVDGAVVASTAGNNASYVGTENLGNVVALGRESSTGPKRFWWSGKMAGGPLGPFLTKKEVSADEVRQLYIVGREALGL